jgi:hypothetical protein
MLTVALNAYKLVNDVHGHAMALADPYQHRASIVIRP